MNLIYNLIQAEELGNFLGEIETHHLLSQEENWQQM